MRNKTYRRLSALIMSLFVLLGSMQGEVLAANVNVNIFDENTIEGFSLGDVSQFGVFAEETTIGSSIESNIATDTLYYEGGIHAIGTNEDYQIMYINKFGDYFNEGNKSLAGEITLNGSYSVFAVHNKYKSKIEGERHYFGVSNNHPNFYTTTSKIPEGSLLRKNPDGVSIINFYNSLERLSDVSGNYMELIDPNVQDGQNPIANLDQNDGGVQLSAGLNVIDVDDINDTNAGSFSFGNIGQASQVILNMKNLDNEITINRNMNNPQNEEDVSKILWNFGDYDGTINIKSSMRGTILAPKATIKVYASSTYGALIGETIYIEGMLTKNVFQERDIIGKPPVFNQKAEMTLTKSIEKGDGISMINENKYKLEMRPDVENYAINMNYEVEFTPIDASDVPAPMGKEVVLVIDTSGSMAWSVDGRKSGVNTNDKRIEIAKNTAKSFIDSLKNSSNTQIGIVTFNGRSSIISDLQNISNNSFNLSSLTANGWTNIGDGIRRAKYMFTSNAETEKYIVLLSDGAATAYSKTSNNNWSFYQGADNSPHITAGNGDNTAINGAEYAKLMSSALDGNITKGYYIGFTKDMDAEGLILDDGVENSSFYYAEQASDLANVYAEISNEIKTPVKLENVSFEETLPEGLSFSSEFLPSGFSLSNGNRTVSANLGTVAFALNDEEKYVAENIEINLTVNIESDGAYIIGDNNSSAVHYTDFDATNGHQYFDEIELDASMMDTSNTFLIETDPKPINSKIDIPTIIMETEKIVDEAVYYPLKITIESENFPIEKVYVCYIDKANEVDNYYDEEGKPKNPSSWESAYPEPEVKPDPGKSIIGSEGFDNTARDPGDSDDPFEIVEGKLDINKSGLYSIYVEDIYGNFSSKTYNVILPIDLSEVI